MRRIRSPRDHAATSNGQLVLRLAACVAGLVLVSGLVLRMSVMMQHTAPEAQASRSGPAAVTLSSDVNGRPLFDGVRLAPGQPADACITVRTHSPRDVGPLGVFLTGYSGDDGFAEALQVEISLGVGTGPPTCVGFEPDTVLVSTSLAEAVTGDHHAESAVRPPEQESDAWYRVRVILPTEAATSAGGEVTDVGITWTTLPLSDDLSPGDRARLLALRIVEASIIPLLLMLVITVLFLGVQDRIDRSEPKLVRAPVDIEDLGFRESADAVASGNLEERPRS